MSTINKVMLPDELENVINNAIGLATSLRDLRKSNKEMDRPKWTDRNGDYSTSVHLLVTLANSLAEDYQGRIGKSELMKRLFNEDLAF